MAYVGTGAFTGIGQVRISDVAGPDLLVLVNLDANVSTAEMEIRLAETELALLAADDFLL